MWDVLHAELMAVTLYGERKFRDALAQTSSVQEVLMLLGLVFNGRQTRLHQKMRRGIVNMGRGFGGYPTMRRLDDSNYSKAVEKMAKEIVGNHPLLASVYIDMLLRTLELAWNKDIGWANLRGYNLIIRSGQIRRRIIGIRMPLKPGRIFQENGLGNDHVIYDGFVERNGRTVWGYFQVDGDPMPYFEQKKLPVIAIPGE